MTSIEKRRERVANGSRRKRDLQAVGAPVPQRKPERWQRDARSAESEREKAEAERQAREARLRPQLSETPAASAAWTEAQTTLAAAVTPSTFALWLEPFTCLGEVDGALCLEAPENVFAWTERRYAHLIGDAIRKATDYRGAFLFLANPTTGPDDGLV